MMMMVVMVAVTVAVVLLSTGFLDSAALLYA
jgi:hypothetical protein